MEGMDSTGFIVGLVVGLLGCLLMVLVQTPRMKATAASPSVDASSPTSRPPANLQTDAPRSAPDKENLDRDEDETKSGKQAPVTPEIAEDDGKKEVKAADPEESVAATPKDPSPGSPARADQASLHSDEPTKPAAESQLSEETLKHLKTWLSEELKVNLQPGLRQLREGHREVLKSLQEILEDKSKADQLVAQVGQLESHITKITTDVSQIKKMDGQIANIVCGCDLDGQGDPRRLLHRRQD